MKLIITPYVLSLYFNPQCIYNLRHHCSSSYSPSSGTLFKVLISWHCVFIEQVHAFIWHALYMQKSPFASIWYTLFTVSDMKYTNFTDRFAGSVRTFKSTRTTQKNKMDFKVNQALKITQIVKCCCLYWSWSFKFPIVYSRNLNTLFKKCLKYLFVFWNMPVRFWIPCRHFKSNVYFVSIKVLL